jgi:hypothetical protein
MTRSNRTLNRVLLALIGLGLLVGAVLAARPVLDPLLPEPVLSVLDLGTPPQDPDTTQLWIAAAACALIIVIALAWVLTRGRGRTRTAVVRPGDEIDAKVLTALATDALRTQHDVLHVASAGYRLRGARVVRVQVEVRPGADLGRLVPAVDEAMAVMQRRLGLELPVVAQLSAGGDRTRSRVD